MPAAVRTEMHPAHSFDRAATERAERDVQRTAAWLLRRFRAELLPAFETKGGAVKWAMTACTDAMGRTLTPAERDRALAAVRSLYPALLTPDALAAMAAAGPDAGREYRRAA